MSAKQLSDRDKHRPGGTRLDHLPRGVDAVVHLLGQRTDLRTSAPLPQISELVAISVSPSGDEARLISEARPSNKEKSK